MKHQLFLIRFVTLQIKQNSKLILNNEFVQKLHCIQIFN